MTIQELKEKLTFIPEDKNQYEVTTESGFKKLGGDIFVIEEKQIIIIE